MSAAPATIAAEGKNGNPFKFSWQQTMLRIKDPAKSLPFYEEVGLQGGLRNCEVKYPERPLCLACSFIFSLPSPSTPSIPSLSFFHRVLPQTLGFHRLHEYKFDSFSLYFLYIPTPEEKATLPPSGTKESEKFLWSMKGTVLELTW